MNQTPPRPLPPRLIAVLAGARRVGTLSVNKKLPTAVWEKMGRLFTVKVTPAGDVEVQYIMDVVPGLSQSY